MTLHQKKGDWFLGTAWHFPAPLWLALVCKIEASKGHSRLGRRGSTTYCSLDPNYWIPGFFILPYRISPSRKQKSCFFLEFCPKPKATKYIQRIKVRRKYIIIGQGILLNSLSLIYLLPSCITLYKSLHLFEP